jgi:hypothetical protein
VKKLSGSVWMGGVVMVGLMGGVFAETPGRTERPSIEFLKALDGRGRYVSLQGRSLFLTSDVGTNSAGYWFDTGSVTGAPALVSASVPGAWDIAVAGNYAWVCDYTDVLTAYDMRQQPWQAVAKLKMPSMTENIIIRGTLAYIANHAAGLTIVDIATPSKPSIVGTINPKIDCDALALRQNYAMLYGHWESRLVLVDITDPAKPVQTAVYQHDPKTFTQGEMDAQGDFAYCTAVNGLVIVNVADPASPKLVKTVALPLTLDVVVLDAYTFVACTDGSVRVLDIADPSRAAEIACYKDKALSATGMAVERISQSQDAAYRIYAANAKGPAMVLRFSVPGRPVNP